MSVRIFSREQQAQGQFNGGAILENKPIGFPQEGGPISAYSNLFYWAHAWSDQGSTIGEHPHQGFEIMSFVMEGEIDHYDSQLQGWKTLGKGSAQIIRSGNGITHAERLNAGAHMFQIWLDPNLALTLRKAASYDDYAEAEFPVDTQEGITRRYYAGEKGPMQLDTPGIEIHTLEMKAGTYTLNWKRDTVYSFYVWKGALKVDAAHMQAHDFGIAQEMSNVKWEVEEDTILFMVQSPLAPAYRTYAQLQYS